jgi:hypothetical protein
MLRATGGVLDAVLEWIERHAAIFIVVGMTGLFALGWSVVEQQREIRQQRADSIRVSCEEVNTRNRTTVETYDHQIVAIEPMLKPRERAQLKQSRDFTVGLINALAPVEDCNARVRQFTQGHPKPKPKAHHPKPKPKAHHKAARAAVARKL